MQIISRGLPSAMRRFAFVAAAGLGLLFTAQAHAATGSLYANGITSPGGSVTLGANLWVADHALGFCRTDASAAGAAAPFTVNQGVCNLSAVSPGQPSFDSARNFVYVPDNSSKSQGVWRLTFNPTTNRVGSPALMAGGVNGLAGNRATATALTADGSTLYVGFIKNGNIIKVTNPGSAAQTATTVAHTSDGRGLSAMALLGGDLYLAEGGGVTVVSGVGACTGTCVAEATGVDSAAPAALASDSAHGLLYVADGGTVFRYRFDPAGDVQDVLATKSGAGTAFANVTGLSLDSADNLYVADDPTAGAQILQGHIYKIAAASTTPAEVAGAPGAPGAPPPAPALTTGTLYADGITSPGGSVTLGSRLWVADHALGFCRTDATALGAAAPFAINQSVCNASAVSPGQPSFDSARNFVYVPDNSSKSQGVWRLTFNSTANTVGSPTLMAGGTGGLTGNRATATALTADGSTLYVGFIKNGNIIKVTNPGSAAQTATTVAKTSDGRGLSAMALIGADLYLAEGGAVTAIPNVGACAGACVAEPTASSATSPTALAAAGNTLYVAETPASNSTILRLNVATGVEDVLATGSDTGAAFRNATGLSVDGGGNLYVGDDPTAGAQILQGHIYKVAPTP